LATIARALPYFALRTNEIRSATKSGKLVRAMTAITFRSATSQEMRRRRQYATSAKSAQQS
jgi:hypothetical protein